MRTEIIKLIVVLLFAAFIAAQSTFDNPGYNRQRSWPINQQRRQEYQLRPSESNYYSNIAARGLDRLPPGATGSLSSIINPGSGSSNNVIGNTNTVYNTFGNRNSFIQNNPK